MKTGQYDLSQKYLLVRPSNCVLPPLRVTNHAELVFCVLSVCLSVSQRMDKQKQTNGRTDGQSSHDRALELCKKP